MIEEYVTRDGIRLKLGRIPRRVIDQFVTDNPEPQPPLRPPSIEIFGGYIEGEDDDELLEDWDDPTYQAQLSAHYLRLFANEVELVASAIEYEGDYENELEACYFAALPRGEKNVDTLRYIILKDKRDAVNVIQAITYNSTVTKRGIEEAIARFDVRWDRMPLDRYSVPGAPSTYSLLFESWRAATFASIPWHKFCELNGSEQSEVVAYFRMENKLQWMLRNQ